jgi:hypothetical protein
VIVERHKECIASLISPYQTRFVPGRNIHENIVIAKEMAHTMHFKKGKQGAFAIKVDISKAYDKLSWEFIWRVLSEIDLPIGWDKVSVPKCMGGLGMRNLNTMNVACLGKLG